ncbi:hypothetical protein CK203_047815 [Vitis vinifera]|uniref:Uncharacterized protein n=1 Tax=Vitis vinifera TaxID=29760 RepID=A0A438H8X0_VITVI|nr:hypothetical protein CK203_047815 [Vitis vinifera]
MQVLACLRSLIRKSVHENFSGDDILKLFPPDLSLDLQSLLILLFQKYQNQWKEDLSRDEKFTSVFYLIIYISTNIYACSVSLYCCLLEFLQYPLPGAHVSYQVKTNVPLSFTPLPSSETPASLWPRQDDSIAHFNNSDLVSPTQMLLIIMFHAWLPFLCNVMLVLSIIWLTGDYSMKVGILPRLKSMTWTMEKRNLAPANRVAFVSLKVCKQSKVFFPYINKLMCVVVGLADTNHRL